MDREKEEKIDILHFCPANLATGGTEGIHKLVSQFCKLGVNAKVLYSGMDLSNPQPKEFAEYECDWVTEIPNDFNGVLIFPEVWGNRVTLPIYEDMKVAINWQGIDVYDWNTPDDQKGLFLQRTDTIHITMSEYGIEHLRALGIDDPIKIPDCLNQDFYDVEFDRNAERKDIVLYNPVPVKMTKFQETVMARATTELGIRFKAIQGLTRAELIDLLKQHKLYIDFGVFSGRERLPREAVMCGCCILTSNKGTAAYYQDNTILDKYKISDVNEALGMIKYVLREYKECLSDFDVYRYALKTDNEDYADDVKYLLQRLKGAK